MKKGFTILEVTLTLAISTLLFISVAAGLGMRISNSRYDTAVKELSSYLTNVYTEVLNTENNREQAASREFCTLASAVAGETTLNAATADNITGTPGRTNCAIYGKIIIFGSVQEPDDPEPYKLYVADLVGDVVEHAEQASSNTIYHGADEEGDTGHGIPLSTVKALSPLNALAAVHADYLMVSDEESGICTVKPAGSITAYAPSWGTKLENKDGTKFIGFAIIARSPSTGAVNTFVYHQTNEDAAPNIPELLSGHITTSCNPTADLYSSLLSSYHFWAGSTYDTRLDFASAATDELGFCVRSEDFYVSSKDRYASFLASGTNALQVADADDELTKTKCGRTL